ncbi:MazG family protein, partial [Nakamurella sp.]|uniref:MazG family protein n=1 Tax=Nakamurella sp. TaxID=1869182 RepID=UPI003B3B4B2A
MTGSAVTGGADPAGPAGDPVPAPPHAALLDAVAVMDRLRSPGGCPWDAEQTHASLVRYLIEECYELAEAVEQGDRAAVREELGDVLLQVLFHARIAAETPPEQGGFDIDDVARDLVAKLVRRHPHVFARADGEPAAGWDAADQQQRWDELKKTERGRSGVLDGVAFGQPAVALAAKLGSRAAAFGLDVPPPGVAAGPAADPAPGPAADPAAGPGSGE